MQLLLDPESQDVLASVSADEHQHTSFSSRTRLNPESKAKVIEWLSNGVTKPSRLLKLLEEHKLPQITRMQINNLNRDFLKKHLAH